MKRHKVSIISLSILILALALACGGGGTPVPMSDIPVYSDAEPIADVDDSFEASMVIGSMEAAFAGEDVTLDTQAYSLASDTTWNDVKSFYTDNISGDWKAEDEFTDEGEDFNSLGWHRGSGANEQVLLIAYVPGIFEEGTTLVVLLISE